MIFSFYIALNTNVSKGLYKYTISPVIRFSACLHTLCAQSPLPGEHSSQALLDAQKLFDQQWRSHPTGYPYNTWVESSKLISCQRILVISGIRTLDLRISSQAPLTTRQRHFQAFYSPDRAAFFLDVPDGEVATLVYTAQDVCIVKRKGNVDDDARESFQQRPYSAASVENPQAITWLNWDAKSKKDKISNIL